MMSEDEARVAAFERLVGSQVGPAWNLARWLVRDAHDAEDVVQEAYLRAFRGFDTFRGGDAKSWFLAIVRNCCHTAGAKRRKETAGRAPEEEAAAVESRLPPPSEEAARLEEAGELRRAIDRLPGEFREALVLRELEGLNYRQIAEVTGVPMGTVMSRLARGRERLAAMLNPEPIREREAGELGELGELR